MTPENLKALGSYLTFHDLAAKSINDFSKKEITDLVNYICDQFGKNRPMPIMYDHADRLIVPANADKGQLRSAIKMIEVLLKHDHTESIVPANEPHVWEQYQ